jgi:hypothetical protein
MASTYPGAVDTFPTRADGQTITPAMFNDLQNAVIAIQTELGLDPAGSLATVLARLAVSLAADGDLALTGVSTLTISGGVVTATGNRHLVDTQGAAATDDLDTINGGAAGHVLFLRIAADARNVVITNAGNIATPGGVNILLDYTNQLAVLVYDAALSKWLVVVGPIPRLSIAAPVATYTALTTDKLILASGTFTITLPAVAAAAGVEMTIQNIGTGTITIEGAGAETINGEANKILYIQYGAVDLACNGSAWYITGYRVMPAYADIHCHAAVVAQNIPTGATYTKITAFTENGVSMNCTPDQANDKITITRPGNYQVGGTISFTCDTNAVLWQVGVFLDGVEVENLHFQAKIGTGTDAATGGIVGFLPVATAPLDIDVRVRHDNGGTVALTVAYANISVNWLGN